MGWRLALSFKGDPNNALSAGEVRGCELKGEGTTKEILKEEGEGTTE